LLFYFTLAMLINCAVLADAGRGPGADLAAVLALIIEADWKWSNG